MSGQVSESTTRITMRSVDGSCALFARVAHEIMIRVRCDIIPLQLEHEVGQLGRNDVEAFEQVERLEHLERLDHEQLGRVRGRIEVPAEQEQATAEQKERKSAWFPREMASVQWFTANMRACVN
jgi:hypothetical protein